MMFDGSLLAALAKANSRYRKIQPTARTSPGSSQSQPLKVHEPKSSYSVCAQRPGRPHLRNSFNMEFLVRDGHTMLSSGVAWLGSKKMFCQISKLHFNLNLH